MTKKRHPFDNICAAYNLERDGSLEKYLQTHDGHSCFPLFAGIETYNELWDKGYLIQELSIIRIMWNVGRGDEHYLVMGKDKLAGLEGGMHSGKEGVHTVESILGAKDCPAWEAQCLSPRPISGKNIWTFE